jgi:hypothetical protein
MARFGFKMSAALTLGAIAVASSAAIVHAQSRADWLASGESVTYDGYLLADEGVYAGCDENCADLDLYLYDASSGELVASDTLADPNPVVAAPYEGSFLIEAIMVVCNADACETTTDSDQGF